MTSQAPETSAPIERELPWCVLSLDRAPRSARIERKRWCRLDAQPKSGKPRYRDSVVTACGFHVVLPCGFEQREPTCLEKGCAPTKEERRARMRWTGAQLRDVAKRVGETADQLTASIDRCEQALHAGGFATSAWVEVVCDPGSCSFQEHPAKRECVKWILAWERYPSKGPWRLVVSDDRWPVQPRVVLCSAPLHTRMHSAHHLDVLLTALLEAEEEI